MEKHINDDDLRDALTGNMNDWLKEHLETCDNCFNKALEKKNKLEAFTDALSIDLAHAETLPHLTESEINQYNLKEGLDAISAELVETHAKMCAGCNRKLKRRVNDEET